MTPPVPAPAGEVPNERLAEQTWGCDHEIVTLAREALERVKALEAALQNVCAHTGHLPGADRELLVALLAKCQTIALGALGAPRPEGDV